jgi:hypothetical protein
MEMYEIYWILKLDDIAFLLGGLCALMLCIGFVSMFILWVTSEGSCKTNKLCSLLMVVGLVVGIINTFVPTTKQYLTMMGGHFLTTNEQVITTTEKGFELLDQYLDERLKGVANAEPNTTD